MLNFAVSVGSGSDAAIRKSHVAHDTINDALYSVAQVEQGTVALGGSSLSTAQAEGRPVESIFVYRLKQGSIAEAKWAVNLQVRPPLLLLLLAVPHDALSHSVQLTGPTHCLACGCMWRARGRSLIVLPALHLDQ